MQRGHRRHRHHAYGLHLRCVGNVAGLIKVKKKGHEYVCPIFEKGVILREVALDKKGVPHITQFEVFNDDLSGRFMFPSHLEPKEISKIDIELLKATLVAEIDDGMEIVEFNLLNEPVRAAKTDNPISEDTFKSEAAEKHVEPAKAEIVTGQGAQMQEGQPPRREFRKPDEILPPIGQDTNNPA